ncbi:MAG: DUF6320 domain-containing protein [Bacteroidales bacterium]|nr:DUF6320 domain-containing protein [Bacteroidales bacterium]
MKRCKNCGVILEENMNYCPLCGAPASEQAAGNEEDIRIKRRSREDKPLTDFQRLSVWQKRKLFWEISGIILLAGIVVTLIIDYTASQTISWSKYPVMVCLVLFAHTTLISFWHTRFITFSIGSFFANAAFVFILDIFNNQITWSLALGIPLLIAIYVIVVILIFIIKHARKRGLNVIAYSFVAGGLITLFIEGFISLYAKAQLQLEWSPIVMASVLPVAALLLFIHFRLRKVTDLKRFFHI